MRMTNIARILNELNGSFSGRNDIVDKLCRYPLLIIDDFGMERGTEYALEQIYNIVDWTRYATHRIPPMPASMTACWKCAFRFPASA